MLFTETQICEVIAETWGSVLGQELTRAAEPPALSEGFYSCNVEFGSGWGGLLSLDLSRPIAQTLAAGMFGRAPEEVEPAEVANAVGELTGLVAGSINGMLSEPADLSLPVVTQDLDHVDYRLRHAGCVVLHDVAFECEGEPVRVTLVRRTLSRESTASVESSTSAADPDASPIAAGAIEEALPQVEGGVRTRTPGGGQPGGRPVDIGSVADPSSEVLRQAEDILEEARVEADQILVRARAEARRLRAASLDVEPGGDGGDAEAESLREDARRYALDVLGNLESYTTQMLESVRKSRDWLTRGNG
jgi:hypothetical protein